MDKVRHLFLLCIALFLFSINAQAHWRRVLTVETGSDSVYFKLTRNITLEQPYQDSFADENHSTALFGGLFAGLEQPLRRGLLWQIGLSYYLTSPLTANGTIFQFTDTSFGNLNFQSQIRSQRVLVETKLLATLPLTMPLHPYLLAGLGGAANTAYGYNETQVMSYAVLHPDRFSSHTTYSPSYALGLGMELELNPRLRLGGGYRYVYLGSASLGSMPSQESSDKLKYKNLVSNEFVFSLSYLA